MIVTQLRRRLAAVAAALATLAAWLHDALLPLDDLVVFPVMVPGKGGGKGKRAWRVHAPMARFAALEARRHAAMRARAQRRLDRLMGGVTTERIEERAS